MSFHEEFSNDRSKLFKTEISDYLMSNATKVNLPKYIYLVACTPRFVRYNYVIVLAMSTSSVTAMAGVTPYNLVTKELEFNLTS